jgi:hypothetical protein
MPFGVCLFSILKKKNLSGHSRELPKKLEFLPLPHCLLLDFFVCIPVCLVFNPLSCLLLEHNILDLILKWKTEYSEV